MKIHITPLFTLLLKFEADSAQIFERVVCRVPVRLSRRTGAAVTMEHLHVVHTRPKNETLLTCKDRLLRLQVEALPCMHTGMRASL